MGKDIFAEATVYGFNEEEELFYFSDKIFWEENKCCDDYMLPEVRNLLEDIGLAEEMEGVWSISLDCSLTLLEIEQKLEDLGFKHNQEFETFMSEEEE